MFAGNSFNLETLRLALGIGCNRLGGMLGDVHSLIHTHAIRAD